MRSKTTTWYETGVRYERQSEDGGQKTVTESYTVEAITFGEAEDTVTTELRPFVTGEFQVKSITPATYNEIFFSDSEADDRWYKAKLIFTVYDEKSDKEKRSSVTFLVQASDFNAAVRNIDDAMHGTQSDYVIANIAETKIMDVLEHNKILHPQDGESQNVAQQ